MTPLPETVENNNELSVHGIIIIIIIIIIIWGVPRSRQQYRCYIVAEHSRAKDQI